MKTKNSLSRKLSKILLLAAFPVLAQNPQPDAENRNEDVNRAAMKEAVAEVYERVQMSAPMAVEIEAGVDPVEEAVDLGLIVEVSLEEVEAALAAAAATPDPQDDLVAMDLRHRGSYRFYCELPSAPADVTGE